MGEVKKDYCDFCKKEIIKETFSGPNGESGVISRRLAALKETGDTLDSEEADVCATCYDKLITWIKGKKATAATDWKVEDPKQRDITFPKI